MRIRDLKWRGLSIWPPEWAFADQGVGESGVLTRVELRQDQDPEFIFIEAEHAGYTLKGIALLEDPTHLEFLYGRLKDNIGRLLAEIGDLEINL
jgi:hypothetical protein